MLIESAFLELPELLLSNFDHGSEVEATIVHLLASALQMEMNARNIPRPYAAILAEKPYEGVPSDHKAVRADLYVDLRSAVRFDRRILAYGVRPKNWLEAKAALTTHRRSSATLRAQLLARDCLRLCLLPEECPGTEMGADNGRYLLWLLDGDPKPSFPSNSWVLPVLKPGVHPLEVEAGGVSLQASVRTLLFEPDVQNAPTPLFWGYLLRVGRFTAHAGGRSFTAEDVPGTGFSPEAIGELRALRDTFLAAEESDSTEI